MRQSNTLLKDKTSRSTNTRLTVSEVEEWGTLIEDIAQHLKASRVVDVDATWPTPGQQNYFEEVLDTGSPGYTSPPCDPITRPSSRVYIPARQEKEVKEKK